MMATRMNDLKRRFQGLKEEAESAVLNVKSILERGKSIVVAQDTISNSETFLRKYPIAGAELDVLINNLVKFNCELEIILSKNSDSSLVSSDDATSRDFSLIDNVTVESDYQSCATICVDKQSVATNTELVCVNNFIEYNYEGISNHFGVDKESILEMKYLQGDNPADFWLGYYPSEEYQSHVIKIRDYISSGNCKHLSQSPAIGQFVIGEVYRGYVLSVFSERITALDIDSGLVKFANISEVWEIEESILNFPPQALYCKLFHIPSDLDWCTDLKVMFQKCMKNCNLVVTVKDMLPRFPPVFVVDVDAHDGTVLDVNMSNWINDYVVPGLEKLKLSSLPKSSQKSFLEDLNPYNVFREEESDSEESILTNSCDVHSRNLSSNDNCSLQTDNAQTIDTCDTGPIDHCATIDVTSLCVEEIAESPAIHSLSSSCSLNDSNRVETVDLMTHSNEEVTQSFVFNEFEHSCSVIDPIDSEIVDATSLPFDENTKSQSFSVSDFIPKFNSVNTTDGDHSDESSLSTADSFKSATVQYIWEKGSSFEMSYFQGNDPWDFVLCHDYSEDIMQIKTEMARRGEKGLLRHFVSLPNVDDFAVGRCNGLYFRARVYNTLQGCDDDYFVVDIDTAEVKVITIFEMWILEEEFAFLPAKAMVCSLWNIAREPPHWNNVLGIFFNDLLRNSTLKVTVKDVLRLQDSFKHIVQVKVSCDVEFDLSEWVMLCVIPKLYDIMKLDEAHKDSFPVVEKLHPLYIYPKKKRSQVILDGKSVFNVKEKDEMKTSLLVSSEFSGLKRSSLETPIDNKMSDLVFPCQSSHLYNDCSHLEMNGHTLVDSGVKSKNKNIELNFVEKEIGRTLISVDFKNINGLVNGEKYYAFLSHIVNPGEFYLHVVNDNNVQIDELQMELQEYCNKESISYKSKSEVKQLISRCCAVNFEGQWCRARITDWLDHSSMDVKVFIVDYGIHVTVPFHVVQYIKTSFYQHPVFALKCQLAQIMPPDNCNGWPEDTIQHFINILDFNVVYAVHVQSFSQDGVATVFLSLREKEDVESINDYLVNEGLAVPTIPISTKVNNSVVDANKCHVILYPPSHMDDDCFEDEDDYESDQSSEDIFYFEDNSSRLLNIGEHLSVVVTEIVNIASFYAVLNAQGKYRGQICDTNDALVELSNKLKQAVQSGRLKVCKDPVIGSVVVACYSNDNRWYRARILSPVNDDGLAEVFFLDYGNYDLVSRNQIRDISKEFSSFPFQAMKFFINGINPKDFKDLPTDDGKLRILYELQGKNEVQINVAKIINEDVFVDVYSEDVNIGLKILGLCGKVNGVSRSVGQLIEI